MRVEQLDRRAVLSGGAGGQRGLTALQGETRVQVGGEGRRGAAQPPACPPLGQSAGHARWVPGLLAQSWGPAACVPQISHTHPVLCGLSCQQAVLAGPLGVWVGKTPMAE